MPYAPEALTSAHKLPRYQRRLELLTIAIALGFVALFVAVAALRMAYPFEFEWTEGAMLRQVWRVADGLPLYVRPGLDFTPHIYAPFYFDLCAAIMPWTGRSFLGPRGVSFVATLGCYALLYRFARKETGSSRAGLVAGGMFAATFAASGFLFDAVRVDSLYLLEVLLGAWVLRRAKHTPACVGSGLLFALAFLTKQSAILILLPLVGFALWRNRRQGLALVLSFGVAAGAAVLYCNLRSDGWFAFYAFELPPKHPIWQPGWAGFWVHDLGAVVPVAIALFAGWLVAAFRHREEREAWLFQLCLALGLVGSSYGARLHVGGWLNVLGPAYAAAALGAGLALGRTRGRMRALVWGLAAAQLAWLAYDPRPQIPTEQDLAGGEHVLAAIRAVDGPVFCPDHPYLVDLAGKHGSVQTAALVDVLRADTGEVGRALRAEFARTMLSQRFAAILLNDDDMFPIFDMVEFPFAYTKANDLFDDAETFRCVTGGFGRPAHVWIRRPK